MSRHDALRLLSPACYSPHAFHREPFAWVEKNCYIDLMIEVLHAQGLEPAAMLPFTLATDYEGGQWTFFKPSLSELRTLYGINVQEMSVWRPLLALVEQHLAAGRLVTLEVDAFWLPDVVGSDYRRNHVKSTIALVNIDQAVQRLGYFHNAGYFELDGEDFQQLFRLGREADPAYLPLYAEVIHLDAVINRPSAELEALSFALLRQYYLFRPQRNPINHFAACFKLELPDMQAQGLGYYHAWAFNNLRQLGAAFELTAVYLDWLQAAGVAEFAEAITAFDSIATVSKSLILKLARAVNAKRPVDLGDIFAEMATNWETGMACVGAVLAAEF